MGGFDKSKERLLLRRQERADKAKTLPGALSRALTASLAPEERVLATVHTNQGEGIAVTDLRVLVLKAGLYANAGMFGKKAISYSFQDISSVEHREGPMGGHLKILVAGVLESESAVFKSGVHSFWGKNREAENIVTYQSTELRSVIREVVSLIQGRIAMARRPAGEHVAPSNDIATQLTRLGELHLAGVLNDEEFDAAKRRVLEA